MSESVVGNKFEGEMLIRILPRTLLEYFVKSFSFPKLLSKVLKVQMNISSGAINGLSSFICILCMEYAVLRKLKFVHQNIRHLQICSNCSFFKNEFHF